jgi:hypothetical protein
VGAIINCHQVIDIDLGIALRGPQAGVAEELLDGTQVSAFAQQMGGKAVAQSMGRDPFHFTFAFPAIELAAGFAIAHAQSATREEERFPVDRLAPGENAR